MMIKNRVKPLFIGAMISTCVQSSAATLEINESTTNTMSPELYQANIDTSYMQAMAEYSVTLAKAANSVALLASTEAQDAIDDNTYTTWKATFKCTYVTSVNKGNNHDDWVEYTYYYAYPTKTGTFGTSINYGGQYYNYKNLSFTKGKSASGGGDCPGYSLKYY